MKLWEGDVFRGVCPQGDLCLWYHVPSGGLPDRDFLPPYGKQRAVRILLECILVVDFLMQIFTFVISTSVYYV